MLGDDVDPEEFSESTGKKILFCCGSCVKAFDGAAAYYIKAVPALAKNSQMLRKRNLVSIRLSYLSKKSAPFIPKDSSIQTPRQ